MSHSNSELTSNIRPQITAIDKEILNLLAKRQKLSLKVVQNKILINKPIVDKTREKQLLIELANTAEKLELSQDFAINLFKLIIDNSVSLQNDFAQKHFYNNIKEEFKVAFLGSNGSYSSIAANLFSTKNKIKTCNIGYKSFNLIFNAISNNEVDYACLPIENINSGSINEVYDLLQENNVFIVGELFLPIKHGLLVTNSTTVKNIDTIYSHAQPYAQCSNFIESLKDIKLEFCSSTSAAMQEVERLKLNNIAAIGNIKSGELFNLHPIKSDIANYNKNYTRFIFIAKKPIEVSPIVISKSSLIMCTSQKPGSLADILMIFKDNDININKLESRPYKKNPKQELFYLDIETNLTKISVKPMLKQLKEMTTFLKILGSYPKDDFKFD